MKRPLLPSLLSSPCSASRAMVLLLPMSLVHRQGRSVLLFIACVALLACSGPPAQPQSPSSPQVSGPAQSQTAKYPTNQEAVFLDQRNDGPPFQFLLKQGPYAVGLK